MIVQRDSQDAVRTFGVMFTDDGTKECETIEKPWDNNAPGTSCIPAGSYTARLRYSPHHGFAVFGLVDVPNRSDIEIHAANLASQLLGCIALGESRGQINGVDAVMASQHAVDTFMAARGCAEYRDLRSDQAVTNADVPDFTLTVVDAT